MSDDDANLQKLLTKVLDAAWQRGYAVAKGANNADLELHHVVRDMRLNLRLLQEGLRMKLESPRPEEVLASHAWGHDMPVSLSDHGAFGHGFDHGVYHEEKLEGKHQDYYFGYKLGEICAELSEQIYKDYSSEESGE